MQVSAIKFFKKSDFQSGKDRTFLNITYDISLFYLKLQLNHKRVIEELKRNFIFLE